MKKILISLLLLFFIGYIGLSWHLSNKILFPESSLERTKMRIASVWGSSLEKMMAPLPLPTDFEVESFDGIQIKGKYFQKTDTANCAIILVHGWTSTWAGMLKYEPVLNCGCDLVFFDHRAHGLSGGDYATGGIKEAKDLMAVTSWVQKKNGLSDKQIGWVGASWGGATVLTAGANPKNVGFIMADAPFQNWYSAIFERAIRDYGNGIRFLSFGVMQMVNWRAGINYDEASALTAAEKIEEPVLLIHSKADSQTASSQSVNIAKQLSMQQSVFHHLDWGGDHTADVLVNKEQYTALVRDFLKDKPAFTNCHQE